MRETGPSNVTTTVDGLIAQCATSPEPRKATGKLENWVVALTGSSWIDKRTNFRLTIEKDFCSAQGAVCEFTAAQAAQKSEIS